MTIDILVSALCLVLVFESLGPMLFPNRWQRYMKRLASEPVRVIQNTGVVLFVLGTLGLLLYLG